MSDKIEKAAVIGLGKLGACMAAALAERGLQVVGVDVNASVVKAVNEGRTPTPEPGLGEMIARNTERLRATTSHEEALADADVCFVIVPTPSRPDGAFSLQYARWAMTEIGKALANKDSYTLVVMTSTVLPGACRHGLLPLLEEASGKFAGEDFGFCYSPEFIALGSVLRDFLNPDFTLVGEHGPKAGAMLEDIYARVLENGAPCRRMSLENAELAKVALNSYVTTKITFANTLAELCARMPGGDVDAVTQALGCDARIGKQYFKGGMGFGGPCFPRDNRAFSFTARQLGLTAQLAEATDCLNESWLSYLSERISQWIQEGGTIAVLGLAYKPDTQVVEASPSIQLANMLTDANYRVVAYDPNARETATVAFGYRVVVQDDLHKTLEEADMVIVATPDPCFKALKRADFEVCKPGVVVYDMWRLLMEELEDYAQVRYLAHGRREKGGEDPLAHLWR